MPVEGRDIGKITLVKETDSMTQNIGKYLTPTLARIADLSERQSDMQFKQLMHHINASSLRQCFEKLDRNAAIGSDGISKDQYEINNWSFESRFYCIIETETGESYSDKIVTSYIRENKDCTGKVLGSVVYSVERGILYLSTTQRLAGGKLELVTMDGKGFPTSR